MMLRVAMCGLGQWGPNLLRNLRESARCEVAALCDSDEARLAAFAALHPKVALLTTIEAVAASPDIDAAVVATPAGLHAGHVELLLRAGKDVLVEKPLAMTTAEGRELVALASELGRILMVGHTFLFNPAVRKVKEELEKGTLGQPRLVLAQRLSLGRVRSDCNALWNLAPHDVSILLYWLGALPDSVSARGVAFHHSTQEDVALCVLEFPGGVLASINVSWMTPTKVRQMTVVGSERMLVYDDVDAVAPLRLYHRRIEEVPGSDEGSLEGWRLLVRQGEEEVLPVSGDEPLAAEVEHFLQCVADRQQPLGSGMEALRVQAVLEACDRSMKGGGIPVSPAGLLDPR